MRPISDEKRELIVCAKKRGEKTENIAKWLKVSVRSVKRIWKLYSEPESVQPKKRLGRKSSIDASGTEKIKNAVKSQPDITLEELIETLDLPIKKSRLSVILISLGLTIKKDVIPKRTTERRCSKRTFGAGRKNKRHRSESFRLFR